MRSPSARQRVSFGQDEVVSKPRAGSRMTSGGRPPQAFSPSSDHGFILSISDTKTRGQDDLPITRDGFGSRLQLMLYRRLLCSLLSSVHPHVSAEAPLSLTGVWQHLGLDPLRPFSSPFLSHVGRLSLPPLHDRVEPFHCLRDVVLYWRRFLRNFAVVGVAEKLSLVYLRRGGASKLRDVE